MNSHPSREEWMSFLYGEDSPARHAELHAHLHQCTTCREQVQSWRGSMAALDTYTISPARRRSPAPSVLRWAAAAAIVVGLGFGLGRATSSGQIDAKTLQASIQKELDARLNTVRSEFATTLQQQHAELAQTLHSLAADAASEESEQLVSKIAKAIEDQRAADHRALIAALNQLEERHQDSYASLRQDLDTVAVNAEEQLMEIAALAKPPGN